MSKQLPFNIFKLLSLVLAIALVYLLIICHTSDNHSESQAPVLSHSQQVFTNIMNRKSVRHYTQQAVSKAQIDTLLRAAMAAPTAVNRQPWAFIVIDKVDVLKALAEQLPYAKMIDKAPVCIIVCGDLNKTFKSDGAVDYWAFDCSAATENMLLQAEAMGLGAVWTALYPENDRVQLVKKMLNIPDHLMPMAAVPIGYPSGHERPKNKYKVENVFYNQF